MIEKNQKWNDKVDKNLLLKEIYQNSASNLTPSVDEWLKMNEKKRQSLNSNAGNLAKNKSYN